MTQAPSIIAAAIAQRTRAGLGLRIFGERAEAIGACPTQYAKDREQLERWIASAERQGLEWEIIH